MTHDCRPHQVSLWSFNGGSMLRCELSNSADPQVIATDCHIATACH